MESKDIVELVTQVRLDIRELATEIRNLRDLGPKLDGVKDIAVRALDRAENAHTRLDSLDEAIDKINEGQNWLPKLITSCVITTIIGGIVGAALASILGG